MYWFIMMFMYLFIFPETIIWIGVEYMSFGTQRFLENRKFVLGGTLKR